MKAKDGEVSELEDFIGEFMIKKDDDDEEYKDYVQRMRVSERLAEIKGAAETIVATELNNRVGQIRLLENETRVLREANVNITKTEFLMI